MIQMESIENWIEKHPDPSQWVLEEYMAALGPESHQDKCRALQGLINFISTTPSIAFWGLKNLFYLDHPQFMREREMCFDIAKRAHDKPLMLSLLDYPNTSTTDKHNSFLDDVKCLFSEEDVLLMCGLKKENQNWIISSDNSLRVLFSPVVQRVFMEMEQSERFRLGASLKNPFLDALKYISASNHETVRDFYIDYVNNDWSSRLFNDNLFNFMSHSECQHIQPLIDSVVSSKKAKNVYRRHMLDVWDGNRGTPNEKTMKYFLGALSDNQHEDFFDSFLKTIAKRSNQSPKINKMDQLAQVFPEHLKPWLAHQCVLQLVKDSQFLTSQTENLILLHHTQAPPTSKRKL